MASLVKLTHPADPGNTIEVDADRAELLKASGWVEPEGKPAPEPKK